MADEQGTCNSVSALTVGNVLQAGSINIHRQAMSSVGRAWNVPVRNPNFTGRSSELDRLQALGTVVVKSLRGMGGVGKTQLAIEYAHRYESSFDIVWWIPAERPVMIPHYLAELGTLLGIARQDNLMVTVRYTLAALRARDRWLLIFDNAEDPAALREFLPSGNGQVLVTTRRGGFSTVGQVLEVDVLERAQSVALVRRRLRAVSPQVADRLAGMLGDLPLALEQASAYIDTTGLPVGDYIALLGTRTTEMIGRGSVAGHIDTLATLWDLSLATVSPAAVQLLDLLAWLAPEPILVDLFTGHPEILPSALAEAVADPVAWADAVGSLVDRFFVRRDGDQIIIVHRMLQQSIRRRHHSERHPYVTAQKLLVAHLSESQETSGRRALLPHVLAVCAEMRVGSPYLIDGSAQLICQASQFLRTYSDRPAEALPLDEQALAIAESQHEADDPALVPYLARLGHALWPTVRTDEGLSHLRRALAIIEQAHGLDHISLVEVLENQANVLHNISRHAEGSVADRRALTIVEATYGPEHPAVAQHLTVAAWGMATSGQLDTAVDLYRQAMRITETAEGRRSDRMVNHLMNLGRTFIAMGCMDDALDALSEMADTYEELHGSTNPSLVSYWTILGNCLADVSELDRALALHDRALKLMTAQPSERPTRKAEVARGLACTLMRAELPAEAKHQFERALAIDELAHTGNHFIVAADLGNIGHSLCALGRPDEAIGFYEKAFAIVDNSGSQSRPVHMNSIAYALLNMGRAVEAEPYLRRALTLVRSSCHPNHLSTAVYLSNLGAVMHAQKRSDEALSLWNEAAGIVTMFFEPLVPPREFLLNALGHPLDVDRRPLDFASPHGTRRPFIVRTDQGRGSERQF